MKKPESSIKRRNSIIAKYKTWEAYLEAMRQAGRRGGNPLGGSFNDPEKARSAALKSAVVRRSNRDAKIK